MEYVIFWRVKEKYINKSAIMMLTDINDMYFTIIDPSFP